MDKMKLLIAAISTIVFFASVGSYASGKQFRPPKSDPCKVNAESEKCKEEKKQQVEDKK